ncbi:Type III flagellar switch regulator (C-ring) FliN C-term [Paracidovorax konjaci]|uniref:Type III flagellar switch regulator (C-ring) FliN C-term n=2 Tax=Paracidovorax konjaci TaxID=32040 RepID=A0A1I1WED2_9BURK|nr:Type III flagellar switch regulator (C-ring) FliN C-term [Paracidovorax konjaci]
MEPGETSHMVPLNHAIASQRLTVHVHLQPVSLTLAQLQSLSVGDVVTLDHCLSDPASLHLVLGARASHSTVAANQPLCTAWLGQVDGHMAVELQTGSL